jgi:hypothetical protein
MMEGSDSVPVNNGSKSGRPKNLRIREAKNLRIWIQSTVTTRSVFFTFLHDFGLFAVLFLTKPRDLGSSIACPRTVIFHVRISRFLNILFIKIVKVIHILSVANYSNYKTVRCGAGRCGLRVSLAGNT